MKNGWFLFVLMALAGWASAAQNYEVSLGNFLSNLAGRQACSSSFFIGNQCGFFVLGFAVLILWIIYAVSVQMPGDGIVLSTSLWLVVLGDPSIGWLPYGIPIAFVLLAGIAMYKAWEKAVTS